MFGAGGKHPDLLKLASDVRSGLCTSTAPELRMEPWARWRHSSVTVSLQTAAAAGVSFFPGEALGCFQRKMFVLYPFKVPFFSSSVSAVQNCISVQAKGRNLF